MTIRQYNNQHYCCKKMLRADRRGEIDTNLTFGYRETIVYKGQRVESCPFCKLPIIDESYFERKRKLL